MIQKPTPSILLKHPWPLVVLLLGVLTGGFLLGVGLGPDALPFAPQAQFSDAVTSHWPAALFLRQSVLEDGALPLWRPLLMSGQPFAANPLNKVWYPLQWLVLILPPTLHLNIMVGLHLVLGGLGMWGWSRRTGLRPEAAALAALGFAFAPRLIGSVGGGHLDLVYAAAWFPWLLWAVTGAFEGQPSRRTVVQIGGIAALCFLADVRLSAYAWATAAIYALWLAWTQRDHRPPLRTGIASGLLAAGLGAPVWMPLLLLWGDLSRNGITLAEAAAGSLEPAGWLGLLIGNHGGNWESMVYVGISTLVLAMVALLRRPRQFAVWSILLLLVTTYAMGDRFILWPLLNRLLPPLRWWRVPGRVWLNAALIWPYLAAWGAQMIAEAPFTGRRARLALVALLGGGSMLVIAGIVVLRPAVGLGPVVGLLALPLTALLLLLAGRLPARPLLIALAVLVLVDVGWLDRSLVEGRTTADWLDPYAELAALLQEDGATRVYSPTYSLPQQVAAAWDIPLLGGVDPFQLRGYVAAFGAATGTEVDGYGVTLPRYNNPDAIPDDTERDLVARANREAIPDPELLGRWLVSHVVAAYPLAVDGLTPLATLDMAGQPTYIYRNTTLETVKRTWDGPNRVTITATNPPESPLYAIATGRWQGVSTAAPGLPGDAGSETSWIFTYDPLEVWAALVALVILSGAAWIVAPRKPRA